MIAFIVPEATTNLITNPSVEVDTTGYTATGTASISRVTTDQWAGLYGLEVDPSAANDGVYFGTIGVTNGEPYTFSLRGLFVDGATYQIRFANTSGTTQGSAETFTGTGGWQEVSVTITAPSTISARLYVEYLTGTADAFVIDALQAESKAYLTTYIDGDQPGGTWSGVVHASTSTRQANDKRGGRVQSLTDFGLLTDPLFGISGLGAAPFVDAVGNVPNIDGQILESRKRAARTLSFELAFSDNWRTYNQARARFYAPLNPDRGLTTTQPTRIRFVGHNGEDTTEELELDVRLSSSHGLNGVYEDGVRSPVTLVADDPFWKARRPALASLSTSQSVTYSYFVGRIDGDWAGVTAPSSVGGLSPRVSAIYRAQSGTTYIGGDFLNWDGIANADYIVAYNNATQTYSALGAGAADGAVVFIVPRADGTLIVGGAFTTIGGTAADQLAVYDPVTDTFAEFAGGSPHSAFPDDTVGDLVIGNDGTVYLAADDSISNAEVYAWDGSSWTGIGGILIASLGFLESLYFDGDTNTLYAGGNFDAMDGVTAANIAQYDVATDTWSAMGSGFSSRVRDITKWLGNIVACGDFTASGSTTLNGVAFWTGAAWKALPDQGAVGAGARFEDLLVDADNTLILAGPDVPTTGDNLVRHNQSTFQAFEFNLPGTANARALARFGDELYIGFNTTGSVDVAGTTTVTNDGDVLARPTITITRSGGTSATGIQIVNQTTGEALRATDYDLQDGEEVIIYLDPQSPNAGQVLSSANGNITYAFSDPSSLLTWALIPGDNIIGVLINETGSPTITAYLTWRDQYDSVAGVTI